MGFGIKIKTKDQVEIEALRAENARLAEENARAQSVIDYGMMMGVIPDPEMEAD